MPRGCQGGVRRSVVLWAMRDTALLPPEPLWTAGPGPAQALHGRANRTYLLTLPVFLVGALLNLTLPGQLGLNPFDRVMLPVLLAVLTGLAALSESGRLPRRTLHLLLLLEGWAYLLGKPVCILLTLPAGGQLAALVPLAPWIPVLLASHAWVLPRPVAHRFTLVGLAGLAFLTVLFALRDPAGALVGLPGAGVPAPAVLPSAVPVLLQVLLAGVVLLAGQRQVNRSVTRRLDRGAGLNLPDGCRDPLTGLPDTPTMERVLGSLKSHAAGRTQGLAVAVMRLAPLDRLQAEHGEAPVTHLQAHLGRVLLGTVREQDVLGRWGPDGFMLLLGVPDERAARAACERLRLHVGTRPLGGVVPAVGVGVAFAAVPSQPLALLQRAAQALDALETDGGHPVRLAAEAEADAG